MPPPSKCLFLTALERGWPTKSDEELEALVVAALAAASVSSLVGLTDEHEPTDAAAMCMAQVYCLE